MANNALVGVSKSKLQIKCPKCGHNTLIDFLEFYIATLEISPFECVHCKSRFNINVELLDPPARTPDTAETPIPAACEHELDRDEQGDFCIRCYERF